MLLLAGCLKAGRLFSGLREARIVPQMWAEGWRASCITSPATQRTGAGGEVRQTATMVFTGALQPAHFVSFAEHRARRLDLGLQLGASTAGAITMTVEGEPDLVDAFEMACSLGPIDCIVLEVRREA